jgi:cell division protein FtsI (penicillin-binding protein 3)
MVDRFGRFAPLNGLLDSFALASAATSKPEQGGLFRWVVSAPIFSRIMSEALRFSNVPPDNIEEPEKTRAN